MHRCLTHNILKHAVQSTLLFWLKASTLPLRFFITSSDPRHPQSMLSFPQSRQKTSEVFFEKAIVKSLIFRQPPRDTTLSEDGGFVRIDRAKTNVERFGHILGRATADKGEQNFLLAFGECSIYLTTL